MSKVLPILFTPKNAKSSRDGSKTQTRRVLKPQPKRFAEYCYTNPKGYLVFEDQTKVKCQYKVGYQLWVKETYYLFGRWVKNGWTGTGKQKYRFQYERNIKVYFPDDPPPYITNNKVKNKYGYFKRPSIFMPRWASRITLEIIDIRVERLKDINEPTDIDKEGTPNYSSKPSGADKGDFKILWDSINAKKYPYDSNPLVCVIDYKLFGGKNEK